MLPRNLVVILAAAATLSIAHASETPSAKAAAPAADPNEVICKVWTPTGTRFPKRFCATRAQFEQIARDSQAETDKMQRTNMSKQSQ